MNDATMNSADSLTVTIHDDFAALPDGFAVLAAYPNTSEFFQSIDWFRCLYDATGGDERDLRIYCVSDAGKLPLAMLFCIADREKHRLASLSNFYTMVYGPLIFDSATDHRLVYDALFQHIANERPRWRNIEFRFLPESIDEESALVTSLQCCGFWCDRDFQYENWYVNTRDQDFGSFFADLPSRVRNTIKRKAKKLSRDHEVEFRLGRDADDGLAAMVDDYVTVYNKSWKRPEPYPEFMPQLAAVCAELGILRLGVLYVDNTPVAAQFWIVTESQATIYKLAYDDSLSRMSPGSILSRDIFEYVLDHDQPAEIDYGVGSEQYKRDWMKKARRLHGLRAINKKTRTGVLLVAGAKLKNAGKRLLRR